MKKFILKIGLLALPLVIIEILARSYLYVPIWYEDLIRKIPQSPSVFLVGSSRIAAAVVPETLENGLPDHRRVYNLGRGLSSPMMHFLGLKKLVAANPDTLKNSLLIIETIEGIPDFRTWKDTWLTTSSTLLAPLLSIQELPRFWSSHTELEDKFSNTLQYFFRSGPVITQFQESSFRKIEKGLTNHLLQLRSKVVDKPPMIREVAGIRADTIGIEHMRDLMLKEVPRMRDRIKHQTPIRNWEETVIGEMVRFAKRAGAKVAFIEIPLSSVLAEEYLTPIRRKDREEFQKVAASWGCPLWKAEFQYSEKDFPDLSHLSENRASEFSALLALKIQTPPLF